MSDRPAVTDELIDQVARSLTAGSPPASLRAAVSARIESGRPSLGSSWTWRLGLPAAALATVLLVVWTSDRSPADPTPIPIVETVGRAPATTGDIGVTAPESTTDSLEQPEIALAVSEPDPVARVTTPASLPIAQVNAEPLAIEPLQVAALQVSNMTLEVLPEPTLVGLMSLRVEPLSF